MIQIHDDLTIEERASQNVDYLSFEWKPEDLWATRYYLRQRKPHSRIHQRLSNALWRAWTKIERELPCSSPELIEW